MNQQSCNQNITTGIVISPELRQDLQQIISCEQEKNFKTAFILCQKAAAKFPNHPVILQYQGILSLQLNQPKSALVYLHKAVTINKQEALLYNYIGVAYSQLEHNEKGIYFYNQALRHNPKLGESYYNLGIALIKMNRLNDAEKNLRKAIQNNIQIPSLYYNLANILHKNNKIDEAILYYQHALQLNPAYLMCAYNLGEIYIKKNCLNDALKIYQHILDFQPNEVEAHHEIATIYYQLNHFKDAANHFEIVNNKSLLIYLKLGHCYYKLNDFYAEINTYQRGLETFPDNFSLILQLIMACKSSCFWDPLDDLQKKLIQLLDKAEYTSNGFYLTLGLNPSQELILAKQIAKFYSNKAKKLQDGCHFYFQRKLKQKIRIGYVSGNVRDHPNAHLTIDMFPCHNKEKFEVYLYSAGPQDDSIYAKRIPTLVDSFVDLQNYSSEKAAKKIYEDNIDILIDMTGYYQNSASTIFALRPSPIQISFLGYCGTSGGDFIDYLVTDNTVIIDGETQYYSEKLIYMPYTYFVTYNQPFIATKISRQEQGLPKDAFIYCCFNQQLKYDPVLFKSWMRILHKVPNSVLWLWVTNPIAKENLHKEAEKHGINKDRIIFASKLAKDEHLARLQLADLFLDSFLFTAHTTAIDALYVGLPLITRYGNNIAARGASSLLKAIGLSELITNTAEEYEEMAVYYATHSEALNKIRQKIAMNKECMPLFNTKLYIQQLEQRLNKVWELFLYKKTKCNITEISKIQEII
jgi:protein O-GlcNAc transferase